MRGWSLLLIFLSILILSSCSTSKIVDENPPPSKNISHELDNSSLQTGNLSDNVETKIHRLVADELNQREEVLVIVHVQGERKDFHDGLVLSLPEGFNLQESNRAGNTFSGYANEQALLLLAEDPRVAGVMLPSKVKLQSDQPNELDLNQEVLE